MHIFALVLASDWHYMWEYIVSNNPIVIVWVSVTPKSKIYLRSSSSRGTGLHTHSTSLTFSSSLLVKGLAQRCVWNDKDYKLALTPWTSKVVLTTTTRPHGPTITTKRFWAGVLHSPQLKGLTPSAAHKIRSRLTEPPVGTHVHGSCRGSIHMYTRTYNEGSCFDTICNTPLQNLLTAQLLRWNGPAYV
jgi:hypothetical protein